MKLVVYDIEIKKAILGKGSTPQKDVEYCSGWNDHKNMGVSCLCAYDYDEDRYRVFCDDNMQEFIELATSTNLLVGFNNIKFDNTVLYSENIFDDELGINFDLKSYDILREIWAAEGLGATFRYPSHSGYGLDAMVKANFGLEKTGWGGNAPVQYQKNEWGSLIDYCMADVWLTKKLFDKILSGNRLKNPTGGKSLKLRIPKEL